MRALALLALPLLVVLAHRAAALPICSDCLLGVYDNPQMSITSGDAAPFELKSLYLGIRLPAGMKIRVIRFAAAYPSGFSVIDWTSYVSGVRIAAESGGVRVEWPECIAGTTLLFRVRVLGLGALEDAVLRLHDASAGGCDGTQQWQVPAGCYVLNPSGRPVACAVENAPSTWTLVKELFR